MDHLAAAPLLAVLEPSLGINTGAVAWILLAGPNAGWLNRLYVMATGAEAGPFNIYSFSGLSRAKTR